MTFNEIIESLKKANVSSPGKALQLLPTYLKSSATDERDTLDLLQARMNRHVKAEIEGRVSRKELNIEHQELVKSVKDFINELSEEKIAAETYVLDKHFEHILLVCSEQRVDYIKKQLFPSDYFPNAKWDGDITGATDHFEIIFFDAKSFENDDVLEDYLKNHSAYLLWFGAGRNSLLDKYPDKAYFCNSPFSVYARLQEMLSFIKYFKR